MNFPGIRGKAAIVTGAGGGIGRAYALALARAGARVAVAELKEAQGQKVAEEIRTEGGEAIFVATDVGSEESTLAMAQQVQQEFGGIDFLINNAAIFGEMKQEPLLKVDFAYYQRFMRVNLDGALLCTRACARALSAEGGGAIVNQSSTAAWMGVGYYGLSKLALNGLTHALARELGPRGVRVNALAPGPTDTAAMAAQVPAAYRDNLVQSLILPRLGQPDDLAAPCLFLLSDAAAWVTGQIFAVDGGQIMRA